jgi:hypothetical protein
VELLVQPQQVLLDRGLGHHQVRGDLAGGRGQDERLIRHRRLAQGGKHVQFAARYLGRGRPPHLQVVAVFIRRDTPHTAACRTEGDDIAILEHPAADGTTVNAGAVA